MIVKHTYILNLKYKQLLSKSGYHLYYYIISKKFSIIHAFLQSLRLKGINFLYVKHTRYLVAPQFFKYFIGGPYIIVNVQTLPQNLISDYNSLKLIALSLNNFFINPFYFQNGVNFENGNFFGTHNFIGIVMIFNFFKSRYQLICNTLFLQINYQVRGLQKQLKSSNDR